MKLKDVSTLVAEVLQDEQKIHVDVEDGETFITVDGSKYQVKVSKVRQPKQVVVEAGEQNGN